jgi:hypothetical protein
MNTPCIPWCATVAGVLWLGSFGIGCAGADDQTFIDESLLPDAPDALEEEGAADMAGPGARDELGQARQPIIGFRSDYAHTIEPSAMSWGSWKQEVYCNEGTYAVGFAQKVETSQGRGDDTALNTVALSCAASPDGPHLEWIDSHWGHFGTWGSEPRCNGFITGVQMRIEGNQGRGDDTAANSVAMSCSNGPSIAANNDGPWGSPTEWAFCGPNTKVCGLSVRVEDPQGGGDDTGMNAIRLFCCY